MHYKFSYIETIADVLPAIKDRDEFSVTDKGDYTCINYNMMKIDTFPAIEHDFDEFSSSIDPKIAAMRRECRGILFSNSTGKIIRRPLHKFMNINENEEYHQDNINLNLSHRILEKLDGSMGSPFILNDRLVWGSKAGITDVSNKFEDFVTESPLHYNIFSTLIINAGYTPIYEFCSTKQRIILEYPTDQLVLLALRHMNTGVYATYDRMKMLADEYQIPVVKSFSSNQSIQDFIEYTKGLEDQEGFVISWDSGQKAKIKSDWYIKIHRAKDALSSENKIIYLYLNNQLDDLLAALSMSEQQSIKEFCNRFTNTIDFIADTLLENILAIGNMERKQFALTIAPLLNPYLRPIVFACFDKRNLELIKNQLYIMIKKNINQNIRYDEMKASIFSELGIKNAI